VWSEARRFARLPLARKALLGEALLAMALARTAMACVPFRRIAAWLGTPGAVGPDAATDEEIRVAAEIGWAVGAAARRIPWDGRCLAQALAATAMLRRRGLEGTVSFGAGRDGASESESGAGPGLGFSAHAWLQVGECVVTGGPGRERFKTLTTFARTRR
jgi:hypothetical protein